MKFCIVHYNTPELITCCISSVNKQYNNAEIIVFENSDKYKFVNNFDNVKIIDNSNGQILNFENEIQKFMKINNLSNDVLLRQKKASNFGTFKHSITIQWLIDNINEDFILLDSDILMKKPLPKLENEQICIADYNENRIYPYIIHLNTKLVKENNLVFCDYEHILPTKILESYDTGGYFRTEIFKKQLKINKIDLEDYIVHFGNGSWRKTNSANLKHSENGTFKDFLLKYKTLWS